MSLLRDFYRDWCRWSTGERVGATLLVFGSLAAMFVTVTLLGVAAVPADALSAPIVSYNTSSDYGGGSPIDWLAGKGYELKREVGEVVFSSVGNSLVLETKENVAALLVSQVNVPSYSKNPDQMGRGCFPARAPSM